MKIRSLAAFIIPAIFTLLFWECGSEPVDKKAIHTALTAYYKFTSFGAGDVKHVYANEFSKGHHQQFID